MCDYDLYKQISKKIDEKLVGIKTSNDIEITDKSKHFIARIIGSVEQRRSGISIEDALDTLINPVEIRKVRIDSKGKSQKFVGKKRLLPLTLIRAYLCREIQERGIAND